MEHLLKATLKLPNQRTIEYKLRSWRLMFVDTDCADIKPTYDEDGDITSIVFDGIHHIDKGTVIPVEYDNRVYNFRINHILFENDTLYLAETMKNISTRFILPALRMSQESIGIHYLLNTFMFTDEDESGDYIYLWYRYVDEDEYKFLEKSLRESPFYVNDTDITHKTTLFTFKIPPVFCKGVKLLINGKYSRISNELKRVILQFHKVGRNSDLGAILYRDPLAVAALEHELGAKLDDDLDIYPKIKKEDETFRIETILD